MTTVEYRGDDFEWLFELLFHSVETTYRDKKCPVFIVNGKSYTDLLKVAMLIPDGELKPHHQIMADELFQKRQNGYRMTAINIAHRCNQIESQNRSVVANRSARKMLAEAVLKKMTPPNPRPKPGKGRA